MLENWKTSSLCWKTEKFIWDQNHKLWVLLWLHISLTPGHWPTYLNLKWLIYKMKITIIPCPVMMYRKWSLAQCLLKFFSKQEGITETCVEIIISKKTALEKKKSNSFVTKCDDSIRDYADDFNIHHILPSFCPPWVLLKIKQSLRKTLHKIKKE